MKNSIQYFFSRTVLILTALLLFSSAAFGQWTTNGNDIYNSNSGNVGVGTGSTVPNFKFYVKGPTQTNAASSALHLEQNYVDLGSSNLLGAGVVLKTTNGSTVWNLGSINGVVGNPGTTSNYPGGMAFYTKGADGTSGTLYERMRIDYTGKVGIGTTSPTTALEVNGDVTVSGNIAAKYQDVAEWVPASSSLAAGTVVTLDLFTSNTVRASGSSYDTAVAGVVSAQPGIVLGEQGENKVKVATTGRVRVRVDASTVPIRIGDLLVTSNREGIAMRSEPVDIGGVKMHRPGTLLGKALESLPTGEGEILVLLSLQ